MYRYGIVLLFIWCTLQSATGDRSVKCYLNPECVVASCQNTTSGYSNVAYFRSTSANDTLHFLVSTVGTLSFFIGWQSSVTKQAHPTINWHNFLSNDATKRAKSITFDQPLDASYALVMTTLLEFIDTNDTGNMSLTNHTMDIWHEFNDFSWELVSMLPDNASVLLNATKHKTLNFQPGGYVTIKVTVPNSDVRMTDLPRLMTLATGMAITVELNRLNATDPSSRFALPMLVAARSAGAPLKAVDLQQLSSIDDEYTPGVFKLNNALVAQSAADQPGAGYIQWKPVVYLESDRDIQNQTKSMHYEPRLVHVANGSEQAAALRASLAYAIFGDELLDSKAAGTTWSVSGMNVSLGQSKDQFYASHNYSVWSMTFGRGAPPEESLSLTVVVIIIAGVGLPMLIVLAGVVFMAVRKVRVQPRTLPYATIN